MKLLPTKMSSLLSDSELSNSFLIVQIRLPICACILTSPGKPPNQSFDGHDYCLILFDLLQFEYQTLQNEPSIVEFHPTFTDLSAKITHEHQIFQMVNLLRLQ